MDRARQLRPGSEPGNCNHVPVLERNARAVAEPNSDDLEDQELLMLDREELEAGAHGWRIQDLGVDGGGVDGFELSQSILMEGYPMGEAKHMEDQLKSSRRKSRLGDHRQGILTTTPSKPATTRARTCALCCGAGPQSGRRGYRRDLLGLAVHQPDVDPGRTPRQGLRARLLALAEEEGKRRGAKHSYLDTFSFQAPGFISNTATKCLACWRTFPPGTSAISSRKEL